MLGLWLAACGWRWGAPGIPALVVGPVAGDQTTWGLDAAIRAELQRAMPATPGAPTLDVRVAWGEAALAQSAGERAMSSTWTASWRVVGHAGCAGDARGVVPWSAPLDVDFPYDTRAAAEHDAARGIAERIRDQIVAMPGCRAVPAASTGRRRAITEDATEAP